MLSSADTTSLNPSCCCRPFLDLASGEMQRSSVSGWLLKLPSPLRFPSTLFGLQDHLVLKKTVGGACGWTPNKGLLVSHYQAPGISVLCQTARSEAFASSVWTRPIPHHPEPSWPFGSLLPSLTRCSQGQQHCQLAD